MRFTCKRERSVFGWVRRPRVTLEVYSPRARAWYEIPDILADTGADITVFPRSLGVALLGKLRSRRKVSLGGIAPGARVAGFVHAVRMRMGSKIHRLPVVVAAVDDLPAILGRHGGLDRFDAGFHRGRRLELR